MAHRMKSGLSLALFITVGCAVFAQAPVPGSSPCSTPAAAVPASASRLKGAWQTSAPLTVPGSKSPLAGSSAAAASPALPATDLGAVPANTRLDRMLLLLEPAPQQKQALELRLASSTTPKLSSQLVAGRAGDVCTAQPWLKPDEFAALYSVSQSDAEAVADWLQAQQFGVAPLPAGRGWIEFSGTAAQVELAFRTQVHQYATAAGQRIALAQDISVPAALAPVVSGLVSLDGSLARAAATQPVTLPAGALTQGTDPRAAQALTPSLLAQTLHLDALHQAGTAGAGQTIAIASRSNVAPDDVAAFRAAFALPASPLAVQIDGIDPGRTGDEAAALMMASWAGAAAPRANILLVPAAGSAATDGVDLSLAAIVDQDLAHTAVVGFSACEPSLSPAHRAFYAALYRQAAAQGMAVIAATGDTGAAACEDPQSSQAVASGLAVNALASTPWDTAVGVAAETAQDGLSAWSPSNAADPLLAGGGGVSAVFPAPAWQPVVPAVPAGRALPDVALPTAIGSASKSGFSSDLSPGLAFCMGSAGGACKPVRAGGSAAAAAVFGGVAALLAERYGTVGNVAPGLYALGNEPGVFEDVQEGSNDLPCTAGSPGCRSDARIGYAAAPGYDLATGLGSIHAERLVDKWHAEATAGTNLAIVGWTTVSQTVGSGGSLTLSVSVSSGTLGVTTVPAGTIEFFDNSSSVALATVVITASGTASVVIPNSSLAAGANQIVALYSGDTVFAPATSGPITISVLDSVTVVLTASASTASPEQAITLTATVTPLTVAANEANPTGTVIFYDGILPIGSASLVANLGDSSSASITISNLPDGSDSLTAVYQGDTYYYQATSNTVVVDVQDFTIAAASTNPPENLDIDQGSAGSASFVVTGLGGFNTVIQVVCTVPTQDDMSCTPNPQQVTPTGTVTFTVQTYTTGGPSSSTTAQNRSRPWRAVAGTALACLFFLVLPWGGRQRLFSERARRLMILLLALVGLSAGVACQSVSGTLSTNAGGTPLGVATLKITAAAYINDTVVSHSVYLTVNVLPAGTTTTSAQRRIRPR